jgi:hypothetical protein
MTRFYQPALRLASAVLFLLASEAISIAQEPATSTTEQNDRQEEKAGSPVPFLPPWAQRRLSGILQADGPPHGFMPAFGDIKRGSGFAPGAGYAHPLSARGVIVLKGAYSINNYKMVQLATQYGPLEGGRLILRGRARWQDAPSVRLYALGSDSPDFRTGYAETKTEVSGEAAWTPIPLLRLLAGLGLEQFDTGLAHGADAAGALLFASMPGAGADPRYLHGQASVAVDSRESPGYSRHGSLLSATLHNYHQATGGPYAFQRADAIAEQYIPIVPNHSAAFLSLHVATTMVDSNHAVPFFLLPDLGGRDLRGFSDYRFRDRHSINWTAEYRWFALDFLDAAIFYDAGKAVAARSSLDFTRLSSSIGGGVRVHGPRTTFLRLELARGREGVRFIIAFSPVGQ